MRNTIVLLYLSYGKQRTIFPSQSSTEIWNFTTVGPRSRASDAVRRREVRARASFFQIRALRHEALPSSRSAQILMIKNQGLYVQPF